MTDKRAAFESPLDLAAPPAAVDAAMRRPITITVGAALVLLRVVAGVLWLVALTAQWPQVIREVTGAVSGQPPDDSVSDTTLSLTLIVGGIALAVEFLLAFLVWRGINWARIVVMVFSTLSISSSFVAWWSQDQEITVDTTLVTLALDILVLLALSSRSARAWSRGRDREHRSRFNRMDREEGLGDGN